MDVGLLNGIAAGIQGGMQGFRDERGYQDEQALKKRLMKFQLKNSGLLETPTGDFDYTPETKETRAAGLAKTKAETSHLEAQAARDRAAATGSKMTFEALPKESQVQIEKISGDTGTKKTIRNSLSAGLSKLNDPNLNDEQKLVLGRQMIKTLNSQQGQDAVGAEEAKRLSSLLEFHFFNFTAPGPVFGRAPIKDFASQVENTISSLDEASAANEQTVAGLYGRSPGLMQTGMVKPGLVAQKPVSGGLMNSANAGAGGVRVTVTNGKETLTIPAADLPSALKDGFKQVSR